VESVAKFVGGGRGWFCQRARLVRETGRDAGNAGRARMLRRAADLRARAGASDAAVLLRRQRVSGPCGSWLGARGSGPKGEGWAAHGLRGGGKGSELGPRGWANWAACWAVRGKRKKGSRLGWVDWVGNWVCVFFFSFPFLFLIQTKLNLFEFKFEFEFKPHSIK